MHIRVDMVLSGENPKTPTVQIESPLLLALGALVYVTVMWDVVTTTLSMHRGGPLTNALTTIVDWCISAPPAILGRNTNETPGARFFANYSNLVLTVSLFAMWFGGLVLSLTVMLSSAPTSIMGSNPGGEGEAATWIERIYFVGASITTAGFGDFVPGGTGWQLFTVMTAASGLVVTSLGVSYVVNLVGAVLHQRQLARTITNLGSCPRDILAAHFDGETFAPFSDMCSALAIALLEHTENHLAYPIIHYVRADDNRDCLPAAIALLDESVGIALFELPPERRPAAHDLITVRRATTAYLESMRKIVSSELPEEPPWPEVEWMRDLWDFTPADGRANLNAEECEAIARRRVLLRAAVQSQGLAWGQLHDSLAGEAEIGLDAQLLPMLVKGKADGVERLRPQEVAAY